MLITVLAAACADAAGWTAIAVNDLSSSNSITLIDTGSNTPFSTIGVGSVPLGIALTPSASTAFVVGLANSEVTPVAITTTPPVAQPAISFSSNPPNFIAVSPDGRRAYVTDPTNGKVVPLDLTTSPPSKGAPITVGAHPEGIAFAPDGATAYATDNGGTSVTPIAVASNTPATPIPVGHSTFAIAVTPDGATAYVTSLGDNVVVPINLGTGAAGAAIPVGAHPQGIAMAPSGHTAYVANGNDGTVTPIDVATNGTGSPISVGGSPYGIAVTPDGNSLYVTDGNGSTVIPVALATGAVGTGIGVGGDPRGLAITPDQPPVAAFTATPAPQGLATSFDASSSAVRFGTIASYAWDFGDGSSATTATPTTTHVYAAAGTYTVTLTETDGAGNSTSGEVFTGQTASRVGGPSAATSHTVTITPPAPVVKFCGCNLDFGRVQVGEARTHTLTITNAGNATLRVTKAAFGGQAPADYRLSDDGCTNVAVAAGESCTVKIAFTPAAVGARNATLAFTDNAGASPQSVNVSGTGFQPEIFNTVKLPGNRRCLSRRVILIHIGLGRAAKLHFRSVRVFVNRRLDVRLSGSRLRSTVDLRGLPKGTFHVTIKGVTTDGRHLTGRRTFHTCAKKRRKHRPPHGL